LATHGSAIGSDASSQLPVAAQSPGVLTRQEFDLTGVNTVVSSSFDRRRKTFFALGYGTSIGLLAFAAWFVIFVRTDALTLGLMLAWILALAWYASVAGFGNAVRLSPGASHLILDPQGLTLTSREGRIRFFPWKGGGARIRLSSRSTHVEGVPDYSLLIAPPLIALLPPYQSVLPISPLTREAYEAVLSTARGRGITIVSVPTSRFLGIEAAGTAHVFEIGPSGNPARLAPQSPNE
jgi:hypothetical protein